MKIRELEDIFTYHPPFGDQGQKYDRLRSKAKELAFMIESNCPDSREKSLALTSLQQTVMWANASIAINEKPTGKILKGGHIASMPEADQK